MHRPDDNSSTSSEIYLEFPPYFLIFNWRKNAFFAHIWKKKYCLNIAWNLSTVVANSIMWIGMVRAIATWHTGIKRKINLLSHASLWILWWTFIVAILRDLPHFIFACLSVRPFVRPMHIWHPFSLPLSRSLFIFRIIPLFQHFSHAISKARHQFVCLNKKWLCQICPTVQSKTVRTA